MDSKTITWLDLVLETKNNPPQTHAKLLGTYDRDTKKTTISLCIVHNGTTYRVVRFHKHTSQVKPIDVERLKQLHYNMVEHFSRRYYHVKWKLIRDKFLKWNRNRLYSAVISKL